MKAKKEKIIYHTEIINGERYMECKVCGAMTRVSETAAAVTCDLCVRESFQLLTSYSKIFSTTIQYLHRM